MSRIGGEPPAPEITGGRSEPAGHHREAAEPDALETERFAAALGKVSRGARTERGRRDRGREGDDEGLALAWLMAAPPPPPEPAPPHRDAAEPAAIDEPEPRAEVEVGLATGTRAGRADRREAHQGGVAGGDGHGDAQGEDPERAGADLGGLAGPTEATLAGQPGDAPPPPAAHPGGPGWPPPETLASMEGSLHLGPAGDARREPGSAGDATRGIEGVGAVRGASSLESEGTARLGDRDWSSAAGTAAEWVVENDSSGVLASADAEPPAAGSQAGARGREAMARTVADAAANLLSWSGPGSDLPGAGTALAFRPEGAHGPSTDPALHHAHLGRAHAELVLGDGADRVQLTVSVDHLGVHIHASAASAEHALALLGGQDDLRRALEHHGLTLSDFQADADGGRGDDDERERRRGGRRGGGEPPVSTPRGRRFVRVIV